MPGKTKIEWASDTWNPITGCTKVSPGCANCYIDRSPPFRIAHRKFVNGTTGVLLHPERLDVPLRWKRPRLIFVNSLSDMFHEDVPYEFVERVFDVMGEAKQHTFQVLTKRPVEMLDFLARYYDGDDIAPPWENVWLGVTIENARQTWRADYLRAANAAVRFISAEPLLGTLFEGDGEVWPERGWPPLENRRPLDMNGIDWIIAGGESGGRHVRPMHPEWAREIRDACASTDTSFFFKQHGSYEPTQSVPDVIVTYDGRRLGTNDIASLSVPEGMAGMRFRGISGKSGGKLLDGREWCEMPSVRALV